MTDRPDNLGEITEIALVGEHGERVLFEHVLTFMYENERYMALIPADSSDDDEAELVFMHIEPDKANGDRYAVVDNEVLCEELFEVFCELDDELNGESGSEGQDGEND